MRIALCTEFPAQGDRVVGGVEQVARGLAAGFAARSGLEVHAVSFHAGLPAARRDEVAGVTVHRFPLPRRFGNVTLGAEERRLTRDALRGIAPDVVHPLGLGPKALGAADAGYPWVVSINGIQSNEARTVGGWKNGLRAWAFSRMEDESLRAARHVIVPNEQVRAMLGDRIGSSIVHQVENAVDESFFALPAGGEPGRIVCVGRLLPLKAPGDLVDAAAELARSGREFRIRFVGPADRPEFLDELRRKVRDLDLEGRVEFLGFLSDAELLAELRAASILAHPSLVEVAPLAVMQAMAASVPAVATDAGSTRHLIEEGVTGRVVPVGRPAALSVALGELLDDPEAAAAMGAQGRRAAQERFGLERVVDRTLDVYRSLLSPAGEFESTGSRTRNRLQFQGITPTGETPKEGP